MPSAALALNDSIEPVEHLNNYSRYTKPLYNAFPSIQINPPSTGLDPTQIVSHFAGEPATAATAAAMNAAVHHWVTYKQKMGDSTPYTYTVTRSSSSSATGGDAWFNSSAWNTNSTTDFGNVYTLENDKHYYLSGNVSGSAYVQIVNGTAFVSGMEVEISDGSWEMSEVASRKSVLKNFMRERSRLVRTGTRYAIDSKVTEQELKARALLRDMLSEREWRGYVTNGFIMVKGASGKWYQVFNRGERVRVYNKGVYLESLCVHTDESCPPTDHVVNMKALIEFDEDEIYGRSNRSVLSVGSHALQLNPEPDNLVAFLAKLKAQKSYHYIVAS